MLTLDPETIDLATLCALWPGPPARPDPAPLTPPPPPPARRPPPARARGAAAAASVDRIVAAGDTVYGVNTGFGSLANTRIPDDRLAQPQRHPPLPAPAGPARR